MHFYSTINLLFSRLHKMFLKRFVFIYFSLGNKSEFQTHLEVSNLAWYQIKRTKWRYCIRWNCWYSIMITYIIVECTLVIKWFSFFVCLAYWCEIIFALIVQNLNVSVIHNDKISVFFYFVSLFTLYCLELHLNKSLISILCMFNDKKKIKRKV